MAVTQAVNNNKAIIFRNQLIRELVRQNMFSPYMGEQAGAVIRTMTYTSKTGGDQVNIPLAKALHAAGVSTGLLSGQEEGIENSGFRCWMDWSRNAVKIPKSELKKMSVDIFDYARPMLSDWGKVIQRDEIVQAMGAIPSSATPLGLGVGPGQRVNGTPWSQATASQQATWAAMNQDRVMFGSKNSNFVAGSIGTSLGNITAANDRASSGIIRVLKKKAETASPQITPLSMDDGYDRYVIFVGPNAFRDLEADPLIFQANKDARPREGLSMNKNPIFNDGDLLYHGCIIRKIPQMDKYLTMQGVGGSQVNVAPMFLCGQSAMVMPWGQLPRATELEDKDYDFYDGKGIEMAYGVAKTAFQEVVSSLPGVAGPRLVDWGVATAFVASPDDA